MRRRRNERSLKSSACDQPVSPALPERSGGLCFAQPDEAPITMPFAFALRFIET
jgi:hypothetical protein